MLHPALAAANEIDATVCDMRFVKPLDSELLQKMAQTHDYLLTIEENVIMGGAGSACMEELQRLQLNNPVLQLGIPDEFIEHGDPKSLLAAIGLDKAGILAAINHRNWCT
jgi:1-deoxy-D-xylulose-5-phosphate synthase